MSPDEENVIRELTGSVGELKGEFKGLKSFIELQTNGCRENYEDLNKGFSDLRKELNGRIVADKIKSRFRKIMENRVTLICVIVMAITAVVTTIEMRSEKQNNKKTETVSSPVSTTEDRLTTLINALERRLGDQAKQ